MRGEPISCAFRCGVLLIKYDIAHCGQICKLVASFAAPADHGYYLDTEDAVILSKPVQLSQCNNSHMPRTDNEE
ncbi:hypothetical protein D3C76_1406460 [compost metagenome]